MAKFKECEVIMRLSPKVGYDPKGEICVAAEKVAELVRCKNYKHKGTTDCLSYNAFWELGDDGFCSVGERKEECGGDGC